MTGVWTPDFDSGPTRALKSPEIRLVMVRFDARMTTWVVRRGMDVFQRWDVEARGHDYLESEINRFEDCLWWRGVKGSTQPSGLAEHKHLPAGDTEEAFWSARSHPGKCPEGKWTYGARVQKSQNGFNILKILTTWDKAGT